MFWHCNTCGHDNEEMDTTCLLCGSPKPVTVAPEKIPVCSLTATRAKAECNYADVTVPSKYNVIGEDAFKGRTDLYTIRIHSGVTKILRGAFDGCTNLYAVYVEGKLTSIGARAFAGCKYLSPERRPTAGTVASDAFVGCSNISLGIPTRTVASSSAARAASGSSATRSSSHTRPSASTVGTTSFTKTTGTRPTSSTGTRPTSSTGTRPSTSSSASSFTKAATSRPAPPPPKPTPPPPPPPPKPSYTPPPPSYSSSVGGSLIIDGYSAGVVSIIIAAIITAIYLLFTNWGHVATGNAWQTAIAFGLVFFVGMLAHYWYTEESPIPICILLSVFSAAAGLNWLLGGSISFLATVLSAGLAAISLIFTVVVFEWYETGCGWWLVGLTLFNLANVIFGAIAYNYNVSGQAWQTVAAVVLILFMSTGAQISADDVDYSIATGLSVFGIIVGGCILWWFGGMLVHFVTAFTLGVAGLSVVSCVNAFKEEETAFGTGLVITSLLNLAVFVMASLLVV